MYCILRCCKGIKTFLSRIRKEKPGHQSRPGLGRAAALNYRWELTLKLRRSGCLTTHFHPIHIHPLPPLPRISTNENSRTRPSSSPHAALIVLATSFSSLYHGNTDGKGRKRDEY